MATGCNRLIRNAIICWNYLYLSQRLAEEPDTERRQALLAAFQNGSIVLWHHLNLLTWSDPQQRVEHALNNTRRAYEAIRPGDCLVWHDFNSPVPWVKVREAIERSGLPDPVIHVGEIEVAFLRKQAPLPTPRAQPALSRPVRVV